MLILLPPSEGKTAPRRGRPVDLAALHYPDLAGARDAVLTELIEVSARTDATMVLKVSPGLEDVVRANCLLRDAPAAPAQAVYTGVLFDALSAATLDSSARRRMGRRVLIFSALFGVLRMSDRIPAYRLSGSVSLPRLGSLSAFWRAHLSDVIDAKGLVVDCRSSAYGAMWAPPAERHLPVRVFRQVDGERSVVSHMAKHSRGLVARALCEEPSDPRHPGDLVDLLDAYFAAHEVTTAAGAPIDVRVELGERSIDVITS